MQLSTRAWIFIWNSILLVSLIFLWAAILDLRESIEDRYRAEFQTLAELQAEHDACVKGWKAAQAQCQRLQEDLSKQLHMVDCCWDTLSEQLTNPLVFPELAQFKRECRKEARTL